MQNRMDATNNKEPSSTKVINDSLQSNGKPEQAPSPSPLIQQITETLNKCGIAIDDPRLKFELDDDAEITKTKHQSRRHKK